MTKKQEPKLKPQRKTGAITVTAKRKPGRIPCKRCFGMKGYGACHECGKTVFYTGGSSTLDAMPDLIQKTYRDIAPGKKEPRVAWEGEMQCAYHAYISYTLRNVQHVFCRECVSAAGRCKC